MVSCLQAKAPHCHYTTSGVFKGVFVRCCLTITGLKIKTRWKLMLLSVFEISNAPLLAHQTGHVLRSQSRQHRGVKDYVTPKPWI